MPFGDHLREYREEYLKIKQKEAANRLDVDSTVLSNYELNKREVPLYLLPKIKEIYEIPDELFLRMVLDMPLKSAKPPVVPLTEQAKEIHEKYLDHFVRDHEELIRESNELRELISYVARFDQKKRRILLNAIKQIIDIFPDTEK
ncbi:helix-turn-helix domain-containing protein [Chungangia koreensis]|uniref:Helix-turn-helix domain-containing protein n=1 Tax=Chungangia koreensis TaxID=752657 RepID=A0ABV8X3Z6_9LACT